MTVIDLPQENGLSALPASKMLNVLKTNLDKNHDGYVTDRKYRFLMEKLRPKKVSFHKKLHELITQNRMVKRKALNEHKSRLFRLYNNVLPQIQRQEDRQDLKTLLRLVEEPEYMRDTSLTNDSLRRHSYFERRPFLFLFILCNLISSLVFYR
ncbi:hypothetical protein SNEBB_000928 [Seison nebaliae]|nr:hypothetical protein SNEBB_000928 [Seison nebaliae]